MAFIRKQGKTKVMMLPVTTSTAFTKGDLVIFTSGLIAPATSSTLPAQHIGVIGKTIASTDSDYATARTVPVEVPVERFVIWEVDTASAVATDVGAMIDLTDVRTANRGATTVKVLTVMAVYSATKIGVVLNGGSASTDSPTPL